MLDIDWLDLCASPQLPYPEILYTAPLQPENQLHIQRRVTDENVLLPHRGLSWCQPLRAQKE